MKKFLALTLALTLLASVSFVALANTAKGDADIEFLPFDGLDDGVYDPDDEKLEDENLPDWVNSLTGMSLPFGQHVISGGNEVYDSLIGVPIAGENPEAKTGGTGVLVVGMRKGDWIVQVSPSLDGFKYTNAEGNDPTIVGESTLADYRLSLQLDEQWATSTATPMTVNSHAVLTPNIEDHITDGFTFAGDTHTLLDNGIDGDLGMFGANFDAQLFAPAGSVTVAGAAQTILDWTFVDGPIRD